MAKVNWDHEKTDRLQRMIGIIIHAIIMLILGFAIYSVSTELLNPGEAAFLLSVIVAAELTAEAWNKWSPWAPSEGEK